MEKIETNHYLRNPAETFLNNERLGFYIASSDQDILVKVSRLVDRHGCVGLMDTAGRVQYLIDGQRGSPYAARKIEEITGRLICRDGSVQTDNLDRIYLSVDKVLAQAGIGSHLKGYRYLRYMLQHTAVDPSLLRPVSKTLYPEAAQYFKVRPSQIERDIRYAISSCRGSYASLSNTAAICCFHDLVVLSVHDMTLSDKKTQQ